MMGYWRMGYAWPQMWAGMQWLWWIWPLALLDLILRGIAMWRSAQAKEKWWFVALFLVNSLGILPGIYLLLHNKKAKSRR